MTSIGTRVRVKPTKPDKPAIQFDLSDNETISGGAGGWESLERPRTAPATAWVATPALQVELPLELDGREDLGPGRDRVVEGLCRQVQQWGLPMNKTDEPPVLRVEGLTRVETSKRWVLQDITWGSYIVNAAGRRVYQQITLTLLEYTAAELVKSPAKRARKRQRAKNKNKKKKKG